MGLGQIVLLVFALLMLVGGLMGYKAAGSTASLIAGVASAVVLAIAYFVSRAAPVPGFWLGAATSLALAVVFGMRLAKTGKMMPSGMLLVASIIALALLAYSAMQSGKA
jgi:uncharacterized membrane protein (UPF0136 family)